MTKQTRAILPLLKAPVTDKTDTGFKIAIGAMYGSPTTIQLIADTRGLDLNNGDILTIYTEVPIKLAEGNG